jgi:hypothetical protein
MMNKISLQSGLPVIGLVLGSLTLGGCFHNSDDDDMTPEMGTYEITVTNLTYGQPLTPLHAVAHTAGYKAWTLGGTATVGLEMLAEGGDGSMLLTDAQADSRVDSTVASSENPFGPGGSQTVMLQAPVSGLQISVATMLANTNDAFTGTTGWDVSSLEAGESMSMLAHAYDAGTEENTEAGGTIPGPADEVSGGGFDAARETNDFVSIHAGVVSSDDGLSTSTLEEAHRWTGPVAKITVARTN